MQQCLVYYICLYIKYKTICFFRICCTVYKNLSSSKAQSKACRFLFGPFHTVPANMVGGFLRLIINQAQKIISFLSIRGVKWFAARGELGNATCQSGRADTRQMTCEMGISEMNRGNMQGNSIGLGSP